MVLVLNVIRMSNKPENREPRFKYMSQDVHKYGDDNLNELHKLFSSPNVLVLCAACQFAMIIT